MTAPKPILLIVEDDPETSTLLETFFNSQGYRTATAHRGDEAESAALAQQVDLVLLDVRLPGLDGYEVVQRLRANRRLTAVPVLMMSDQQDRVDRLKGLELGAEDYVAKPFDLQELGLRVRNSLDRARRKRTVNPVTLLAEGRPMDEALQRLLLQPEWSLAAVRVDNLDSFRASRGFPVADSLLQTLGQALVKVSAEKLKLGAMIGHLAADEFVILSDSASLLEFAKAAAARLTETAKTFYPVMASLSAESSAQVQFQFRLLSSSDGPVGSMEELEVSLEHTPPRTL